MMFTQGYLASRARLVAGFAGPSACRGRAGAVAA